MNKRVSDAFTVVEVIIVIVVIGILAAVTIVSYRGVQNRAYETSLQSDLQQAASELELQAHRTGTYPGSSIVASLPKSDHTNYQYTANGSTYCLMATSTKSEVDTYYVDQSGKVKKGRCTIGSVSKFAGSTGIAGHADGQGAAARFSFPRSIAIDAPGNMYVTEADGRYLRKITPGGLVTTLAGNGTSGRIDGTGSSASFNYMYGVAVDSSGTIYVGDGNTVRKVSATGVVTTLAGNGTNGSSNGTGSAARFDTIQGLAVDNSGNIYVADLNNHAIRKITPGGTVTTFAGLIGASGYSDGTGTAARFSGPSGIAIDQNDNLYVTEIYNARVRKITPSGVVTTIAGNGVRTPLDGTGSSAQFRNLYAITVSNNGTIYAVDSNHIRTITPAGIVTTLAGSDSTGSADGEGNQATFNQPYGIAVDSSGILFVTDAGNHLIRKIL